MMLWYPLNLSPEEFAEIIYSDLLDENGNSTLAEGEELNIAAYSGGEQLTLLAIEILGSKYGIKVDNVVPIGGASPLHNLETDDGLYQRILAVPYECIGNLIFIRAGMDPIADFGEWKRGKIGSRYWLPRDSDWERTLDDHNTYLDHYQHRFEVASIIVYRRGLRSIVHCN